MGELDLNLSTKPFPAYRVRTLAMLGIFVVLAAISAWQGFYFQRYKALAGEIRQEDRNLRDESEVLARRLAELQSKLSGSQATAKMNEIGFLNNLIGRRNFSWTLVFSQIESMIPDDVRLTSLQPEVHEDGTVLLQIELEGRNIDVISRFYDTLEESAVFESLKVTSTQKLDSPGEERVIMTATYFPHKGTP